MKHFRRGLLWVWILIIATISGIAVESEQHTILERNGWNLISICADINKSEVNMGGIEEIQSQNGLTIYTGEYAELSNLNTLYAGYGYWIKGQVDTFFNSGEARNNLVKPLTRNGWNLMASCENISRTEIEMNGISEIQSQNGDTIYTGQYAAQSNLDILRRGYGYWVYGNQGTKFTSKRGLSIPSEFIYPTINNAGTVVEGTHGEYIVKVFANYEETANDQALHTALAITIDGIAIPLLQIQGSYKNSEIIVAVYNSIGTLVAVSDNILLTSAVSVTSISLNIEDPYGNGGGTDPYGNAGGTDPYGNGGGTDPYGNGGGYDPYGNGGGYDPYGNAGGYDPYGNGGGDDPYGNGGGDDPYGNGGGDDPYGNGGGYDPYGNGGGYDPYGNGGGTDPYSNGHRIEFSGIVSSGSYDGNGSLDITALFHTPLYDLRYSNHQGIDVKAFSISASTIHIEELNLSSPLINPTWIFKEELFYSLSQSGEIEIDETDDSVPDFKVKYVTELNNEQINGMTGQSLFGADVIGYQFMYQQLQDVIKFDRAKAVRSHNNTVNEYYVSIAEFISHQQGGHWFMSKEGNQGGISFATGSNADDGLGTLVEVDVNGVVSDGFAGTWEVDSDGILFIDVNSELGYHSSVFKEVTNNGSWVLLRGEFKKAGTEESFIWFNEAGRVEFLRIALNLPNPYGNGGGYDPYGNGGGYDPYGNGGGTDPYGNGGGSDPYGNGGGHDPYGNGGGSDPYGNGGGTDPYGNGGGTDPYGNGGGHDPYGNGGGSDPYGNGGGSDPYGNGGGTDPYGNGGGSDPYGNGGDIIPFTANDALIEDQWYLNNTGTAPDTWGKFTDLTQGADMRVFGAWNQGVSGRGVVVTISDDGVDFTHPDLGTQEEGSSSLQTLATAAVDSDDHGTGCAGIIAAKADTDGVVGIAPDAKLISHQILGTNSLGNESTYSKMLRDNVSQVSNHSYGPNDDGILYPQYSYEYDEIKSLVTQSNNGKGHVLLFASGNGRSYVPRDYKPSEISSLYADYDSSEIVTKSYGDYAGLDMSQQNPYVISVSGFDANNKEVTYAEAGPAVLVAGATGNRSPGAEGFNEATGATKLPAAAMSTTGRAGVSYVAATDTHRDGGVDEPTGFNMGFNGTSAAYTICHRSSSLNSLSKSFTYLA